MKEELKKVLKFLALGTLVLLLALLLFGFVQAMDWPLWVGLFLALLVVGAMLAGLFFRKLWFRKREQSFVENVMEQEASRIKELPETDRNELQELQTQWKRGMDALCGSQLKKRGDPLYVLPWYLMIGASGSSKTTSLHSAASSSPFLAKGRAAGGVPTRNCEWWFLEQAVIIDTAGRYAVPVDEDSDKEEWRHFLQLLAKYRKREPLNGVVVTCAADRLLVEESETLASEGRTVRRCLDELMQVLGVKFPVYLLVTKCDLIHGMNEFTGRLPEKCLNQAMGVINEEPAKGVATFVSEALTVTSERLRSLRLQLLLEQAGDFQPGRLLFPEEFAHLKAGLNAFMAAAFGSNHYQETPLLRGLFFSSGHQKGTPYSRFESYLATAAEDYTDDARVQGQRGIFLHDFFGKILPQDRWLVTPTRRTMQWQQVTGNLGLVSWLILGIAICGLLSFSFVKNISTIRQISHHFSLASELKEVRYGDLAALDRYRQSILSVEERNRHWWIPRFGLHASLKVEQELKQGYCRKFRDGFLAAFDRELAGNMAALSPGVTDAIYAEYVVHLARRINLLRGVRQGVGEGALQAMPQPGCRGIAASGETAARESFAAAYLCYLSWGRDSAELGREAAFLQGWLRHLLALKGNDLIWMTSWLDRHGSAAPVTLGDFWGGSRPLADEKTVPHSFTRKGKSELDALRKEVEMALADPKALASRKAEFENWYKSASRASWEAFAIDFSRGSQRLKGEREWQEVAARMVTEQGPYLCFLSRLGSEFATSFQEPGLPCWLQQVQRLLKMQAGGAFAESLTVTRATGRSTKLLASLEKKVGRSAGADTMEQRLAGSRAYRDYRSALSAIAPATASRLQAYQAAMQLHQDDTVTGKSPLVAAFQAAAQLRAALGTGTSSSQPVGQLVAGPVGFLWSFIHKEASAYLQSQWEEQVLAGTLGMNPQQATPLLLGPEGLVWRFVKGPAAPFLSRSLRGYHAKEVLGASVQFDTGFLAFLARGSEFQAATLTRQPTYSLGIEALPTDANPEAQVRPQGTRLELQCGASSQSLVNLNYPIGKTFNWSPDSCGDLLLQIEVGDLVLTRRYPGPQGFPEFLNSFPAGHHTFTPGDFPGEAKALQTMGVRYIRVNYRFTGSGAVIKQATSFCSQVPRTITRCWTE
ncbi:MAG TPA: type VI secretion protein IcmF/TssM N-terminal domain-containing protein [Geomonas sp.]|nr:type VI secretion protein IcmF/TssM N-terminal domain-containing protein [Geomonas sp.]